ncbi:hypothetical protein TSUD_103190 [Trifolium subterraneum]|uniref:Uncharacterized protein n=1 Tax=Trifolium subterraneum TaxID=3900 RepID=A0A2Z6NY13_TRISU|nr:hypothetical protein TSUD_103190 [Trifolium subterraneum]
MPSLLSFTSAVTIDNHLQQEVNATEADETLKEVEEVNVDVGDENLKEAEEGNVDVGDDNLKEVGDDNVVEANDVINEGDNVYEDYFDNAVKCGEILIAVKFICL